MLELHNSTGRGWRGIAYRIGETVPIPSRIGDMHELIGFQAEFCNPLERYINPTGRRLNLPFAIVELLDFMLDKNPGIRGLYNKQMVHFINQDTGRYDGHYGDRIYGMRIEPTTGKENNFYSNQWDTVYGELCNVRNSRRAVIVINNPIFENYFGNDVCCTLSLQFLLRDDKLTMVTSMRSEDVYLGFCYDTYQFQMMQEMMASILGVKLGSYFHNVGSIHLYTKDKEKLDPINNDMGEKFRKFEITSMKWLSPDWLHTQLSALWSMAGDAIAGQIEDARSYFDSLEDPYLMQCAYTLLAEGCRRHKMVDEYYYWHALVKNEFQDYFGQMAKEAAEHGQV